MKKAIYSSGKRLLSLLLVAVMLLSVLPLGVFAAGEGLSFAVTCNGAGVSGIKVSYAVVVTPVNETAQQPSGFPSAAETDETGAAAIDLGENGAYLTDDTMTVTLFWSVSGSEDYEAASGSLVLTEETATVPVVLTAVAPQPEMAKVTYEAPENGTLTVMCGDTMIESGSEIPVETVVTITATANDHCHIVSVTANGAPLKPETDGSYSTRIDKDTVIAATFEKDTFIIASIVNDGKGGSAVFLTEDGKTASQLKVTFEQTVTLRITPDDGYYYDRLELDDPAAAEIVKEELNAEKDCYDVTIKVFDTDIFRTYFSNSEPATLGPDGNVVVFVNDNENNENGIEKETNRLFVIYPDRSVIVKPIGTATNVKVNDQKGNRDGNYVISNSMSITSLEVYYRANNEKKPSWHSVSTVTEKNPIYIVVDETAPTVTITGSYFKGTGSIAWTASDPSCGIDPTNKITNDFSGLAEVSYAITQLEVIPPDEAAGETEPTTVEHNFVPEGEEVLFSCENALEAPGELLEQSIALNNLKDGVYTLTITATDFAGNTGTFSKEITIDNVDPVLTYDNGPEKEQHYNSEQTITLTLKDANLMSAEAVKAAIAKGIICEQIDGEVVFDGEKKLFDGKIYVTSFEGGYTITITIPEAEENLSRAYTVSFACDDLAGNRSAATDPVFFIMDSTSPLGEVRVDENTAWQSIADALTLGILYAGESFDLSFKYKDDVGVVAAEYILLPAEDWEKYADNEILDAIQQCAADKEWNLIEASKQDDEDFYTVQKTVTEEEVFVIVMRIDDAAGNRTYITSDGLIACDKTAPFSNESNLVLEITGVDETKVYNGDVTLSISVKDKKKGSDAFSGIQTISYTITAEDNNKQESGIWSMDPNENDPRSLKVEPSSSSYGRTDSAEAKLTVSKDFNSNNIEVSVTATDLAGNSQSVDTKLKIDTTAPMITISPDQTGNFLNKDQTFTIEVQERNFDSAEFDLDISATDGGVKPALSVWTLREGTGNKDDTIHQATITFRADGIYSFKANCKDMAGNSAEEKSVAEFIMDQTAPKITVSYYNNDVANGKYFKAYRTATVTIVEHNFDPARVIFTPAHNVAWSNSGDTHTATIAYNEDGNYTFDVRATDKADNANQPVSYNGAAPQDFVIDTTFEDMIGVEGVEDKTAYGYTDTVIPEINISDTNLDGYEITLTGEQRGETIDLSEQVAELVEEKGNVVSAVFDLFAKQRDLDGIYTLTVNSTDLAGNADEQVVTFTVNRYGSVYSYDDYVKELIRDGGAFVQSVDDSLTFTIYNASPIDEKNISVVITRDGRPVEAKYTVEKTSDGSGWYSYLVTIDKSCLADDGVYSVSVTSTDDANNTVENTDANSEGAISFRVDSIAPQLSSVIGLENRIINASEQTVTYTVYDTIGLASVLVYVDGELVNNVTEFDDPSNYEGTFTISEKSSAQHIRFVLTDKAGNVTDSDKEGFEVPYALERDVTVSSNLFVRWYANTGLFWGSIGGAGLAAAAIVFALAKKKKKQEDKVAV